MTIQPVSPDPSISQDLLAAGRQAYDLDRSHVFHSWSAQGALDPMTIVKAEGSHVWDGQGRRMIDFSSQMINTNIGHSHPAVVSAIQEQAAKIATIAPAHVNDARSEAARLVAELTPGDLDHVFFTNAGAEAVEHAVRMARLHTGRPKVLSAYRSYHGGTDLAINVTGSARRFASDRGAAGVAHFFPPYPYRSAFHAETPEQETERALDHLEQVIQLEGPGTLAAVILESVPGTAGIFVPPAGYMEGVRELTRKYGILFIADEVMVGFGRTGRWFGVDHWGVEPDLLTFAKGVNSGYVPLGGVAISGEVYATFTDRAYPGGLTYSGHPLACAAAVATINAMQDESMVANAARIGTEILAPRLRELMGSHRSVGDVRGLGAFWAVELVKDRTTKEPMAPYGGASGEMGALAAECKKFGLLPFVSENRLHIAPPLNTPDEVLHEGLDILDQALAVADEHAAG
ncbi:aspartate aminotransferase family protein [Citricoccus sp. NPDC055426]|uniref:aspartate aminotransferase family protein n=1 Tax=Citricoccus sp. NPDC055426 TaxID=3155536 RepID=UPI00342A24DD